ncbi:MAG: glycosyltransferase family 4 protein [Muribaculaceae bacterium]|nr:glycosyltransferase family 4 protein [Muribaculaceae bacterium]
MKIAVLFEGNIDNRLGVFNAVVNRAKHLAEAEPGWQVDVYMVQVYDGAVMRWLRRSRVQAERPATVEADGVTIHVWWFKRSLLDALGHRVLHRRPRRFITWLQSQASLLADYDLISSHDRVAAQIGAQAAHERGVPHCVTWHGASIYTDPPRDAMLRNITIELLRGATCNFFVSRGLEKLACELAGDIPAEVLYNGASDAFHRYDDDERAALRAKYGVHRGHKVVAFIGRHEPVKNVMWLPDIYTRIKEGYAEGEVTFWSVGDGWQRPQVEQAMKERGVDCRFWGLVPPDEIPAMLNCVDVLVLPSLLEGLPLVLLEAMQCGALAVSSDVVGCPEAVGADNAFDVRDPRFNERFAARAVQMLQGRVAQIIPATMNWPATATREAALYRSFSRS